jgi:ubiquinone/menaquinone biosynthesis C-methylase UbiE
MEGSFDYTRRSYERRADSYDTDRLSTDTQRLWHSHDLEALDALLPRSGRILEVACGTGRLTIPLARTGRTIVGMELADAMLRKAVGKSRDESTAWVQGNAVKLPFRNEAFDALYAVRFVNLFHARDLKPVCDEFLRVIRPGGTLVIHISNALYGAGISLLRQRLGTYNKYSLWPWQLSELFPNAEVRRSVGSYLPFESQLLVRLGEPNASRVRRFVANSHLRYATHTRFVQLVKTP